MKILFDRHIPAGFAPGGAQIQVDRTLAALAALGVEVEPLRWWDEQQTGELVHFFGTCNNDYLGVARAARRPVVVTTLFTETCNRSVARLSRQGLLVRALLALPFGDGIKQQLAWRTFHNCDQNVVGLAAEREVLRCVYRVPDEKISVVPLGLSEIFLNAGTGSRGENHLITTGTITERKNSVALAELAHAAQVPILFVGKPYHAADPYWRRFEKLVDGRWVKLHPHVEAEAEMAALLRAARGFVFMSAFENWCLSAHEAAACGLPLLVQDQNWSRERFGAQANYFPGFGVNDANIRALKKFYDDAPKLAAPGIKLNSWRDVAVALKQVYEKILAARA